MMHKSFPCVSSLHGLFRGYASFFNTTDQQRDKVVKGAFQKSLRAWKFFGKWPKMLWQHDPKMPIGLWTHLQEDDCGLYAEGRLALGLRQADEAYFLLKEGILDNLSIGFRSVKAGRDPKTSTRLLLEIDLLEISLVTFGANSRALVQGVKEGEVRSYY